MSKGITSNISETVSPIKSKFEDQTDSPQLHFVGRLQLTSEKIQHG